jgi:cell division protein FtsQ
MPKPIIAPKPKPNWRTWLRLGVWIVAFAGAAWGAKEVQSFLLSDPDFTLAPIDIHGTTYTNKSRILAMFGQDKGKSVFKIPLAERRRHLLAIDWVKSARITRVWPNRLVIEITERHPVSFAKLPVTGSTRHFNTLIDEEGVLLSIPPRVRFRLPLLSGVSEEQTDEERRIRVEAMQHLLADLGTEARRLSEINVASTQELRVMASVDDQPVELWLGDQHFRSRFVNFASHFSEIRKHSEGAHIFDLRMDDRILAR